MKVGDVITASGYEVEKLAADAWVVRNGLGDLWVVSTWPDGTVFSGVPWAIHAVRTAEQSADLAELEAAR